MTVKFSLKYKAYRFKPSDFFSHLINKDCENSQTTEVQQKIMVKNLLKTDFNLDELVQDKNIRKILISTCLPLCFNDEIHQIRITENDDQIQQKHKQINFFCWDTLNIGVILIYIRIDLERTEQRNAIEEIFPETTISKAYYLPIPEEQKTIILQQNEVGGEEFTTTVIPPTRYYHIVDISTTKSEKLNIKIMPNEADDQQQLTEIPIKISKESIAIKSFSLITAEKLQNMIAAVEKEEGSPENSIFPDQISIKDGNLYYYSPHIYEPIYYKNPKSDSEELCTVGITEVNFPQLYFYMEPGKTKLVRHFLGLIIDKQNEAEKIAENVKDILHLYKRSLSKNNLQNQKPKSFKPCQKTLSSCMSSINGVLLPVSRQISSENPH